MRTIVFGGSGFFGRELIEILLSKGHHVTMVTRGKRDFPEHKNLEKLIADRNDLSSLKNKLDGKTFDLAYDQLGCCSNEAEILTKALEGKIEHLIFTSSKSVYNLGKDLREDTIDTNNLDLKMGDRSAFDYAEGKRQAEAFYLQKAPFKVGCFRPPVVIGMGDTSDRWNWHLNKIKKGEPIYFPNLEAYFCVLSSKDAGLALLEMGEQRVEGPLNFFTANPKLSEILSIMESGVGRKALLAKDAKEGEHSPYGIEDDWFMSNERANLLGIKPSVDFVELAKTLSSQ